MGSRTVAALLLPLCVAAQEDASSLARCGTGEVVGVIVRVGEYNPAGLAWLKGGASVLSTVPFVFGIDGLHRSGALLAQRLVDAGIAISGDLLVAGSSRRVSGRTSIGFRFDEEIGVGAELRLARWIFPRYSAVSELSLGAGLMIRSGPATSGSLLRMRVQQGRQVRWRDLSFGVGCAVTATENLEFNLECMQEPVVPLTIRYSMAYVPIHEVSLVVSWSDDPGSIGAGVGCTVSAWSALFGAQWHPELGWTQALDLRLSWE